MFSKHSLPYDPAHVPADKRFRANASDLFLGNDISAARAASLFRDAAQAGTQHVRDLSRVGAQAGSGRNMHRDILRKMLKRNQWPSLYYGGVRVWNRQSQRIETQMVPVMLPHETLAAIAEHSDINAMSVRAGMSYEALSHLQKAEATMVAGDPVLGLGLWIDATPCNWDRSESVETFSVSLPGLTGDTAKLRLPFAVMMAKHCVAEETFDDLLEILVWSLRCFVEGRHPARRHDNQDWRSSDRKRAAQAGKSLGIRGVLTEIRGDWKCLKEVFRLPGWQERASCCWKCSADHTTRRDCSLLAPWRTERMGRWDMMIRWHRQGIAPCSIVGAPFFEMDIFCLDWLHVMDLGVSLDFMGNLFVLLLKYKPGRSKKERISNLYKDMVEYYDRCSVESRLDNLTDKMLQKSNCPPRLRARGAEARGLIDFAYEQATMHLSDDVPIEAAAKHAAVHLQACYFNLHEATFRHESLAEHSRKFCLLLAALEEHAGQDSKAWRLKPKAHQMQELCEMSRSNPSKNWTYRDEDFGGSMAALARVRGGKAGPMVVGRNVLLKFQAKHPLRALR